MSIQTQREERVRRWSMVGHLREVWNNVANNIDRGIRRFRGAPIPFDWQVPDRD